MSEIPKVSALSVAELNLSKEAYQRFLQWKKIIAKAFDHGVMVEEDSAGMVNFADDDGVLMQAHFKALQPEPPSMYAEAYFYMGDRAYAEIVNCGSIGDDNFDFSGSPLGWERTWGTWEEIYHKVLEHLRWSASLIPELPGDEC